MDKNEIQDFRYFTDGNAVLFCDPEFGDRKVCVCLASHTMNDWEVAEHLADVLNKDLDSRESVKPQEQ